MSIRERRINVKVKLHTLDYYKCTVTLNVIRYRGTLQSQWSTLTDCTSRKAEENVISQYRVLDYFYPYISLTVKLVAKSANIRSLFKVSKNP